MAKTDDQAALRELVESWAKAVRDGDMDGVLAHHTDDILMFDVPVPLQAKGMKEYRDTWVLFFKYNTGGPGSFDITDLQIFAGGTVAYCHALIKIFDSTARLTMGLRKENDRWLIAHEHHSYPHELETD